MPWLRRLWRAPAVAGWVVLGLLLSGLLQLPPLRWSIRPRQTVTCWWMRGLLQLLPLRIRCHGRPPRRTALWVGNHVSWLDIILLGAQAPVRFVSKAEVRHWPLLGWLAHQAGTLFIQRGQTSTEVSQRMASVLEQDQSLVIFAEGTTTAGDRVRTFHGRLLGCVAGGDIPVQPVALAYGRDGQRDDIAPFIDDDEFSRHLWRLLGSSRIGVELHFLPLIDSSQLERNRLARSAHQSVVQALGLETSKPCQSAEALSAAA